jgi:hypothetical protein
VMDYPGIPEKGHEIIVGESLLLVTRVEAVKAETEDDPEYRLFVGKDFEDDKASKVDQEDDAGPVETFLSTKGNLIEIMGLRSFLQEFYNDLDKQGKIVH